METDIDENWAETETDRDEGRKRQRWRQRQTDRYRYRYMHTCAYVMTQQRFLEALTYSNLEYSV